MQGQDIAILIKLVIGGEEVQSKELAELLFLSPSEVSKAQKRCVGAGLLSISRGVRRVNRSGLMEFLGHGLRYAFPAVRGSMVRGIATATAAEPLRSHFSDDGDPPPVWPYAGGDMRGISLAPLYKGAPPACLLDPQFYAALALCDAIRTGRTRERTMAIRFLEKQMHA